MNSQPRYDARLGQVPLCDRDRRVLARSAGRIPQDLHRQAASDKTAPAADLRPARSDGALWIALAALVVVWVGLDATLLADGFDPRLFVLVNAGLAAAAFSQIVVIRRTRPKPSGSRAGTALRAA